MIEHHNPLINTRTNFNMLLDAEFDTSREDDFMMGFTMQTFGSSSVKDDPRFIKWFAVTYISIDGKLSTDKLIELKKCTEEDYDRFYPPERNSAPEFANIREQKGLFCLDWKALGFNMLSSTGR
mmetsp:Transcript_8518/g.10517  ORF Transcript_8518/g.10517 Transcript_8518/m.10517 type:complete len:124 (-) Transcript_8518:834-1205(-)